MCVLCVCVCVCALRVCALRVCVRMREIMQVWQDASTLYDLISTYSNSAASVIRAIEDKGNLKDLLQGFRNRDGFGGGDSPGSPGIPSSPGTPGRLSKSRRASWQFDPEEGSPLGSPSSSHSGPSFQKKRRGSLQMSPPGSPLRAPASPPAPKLGRLRSGSATDADAPSTPPPAPQTRRRSVTASASFRVEPVAGGRSSDSPAQPRLRRGSVAGADGGRGGGPPSPLSRLEPGAGAGPRAPRKRRNSVV
mmetsp:Transcript_477/g.1658  ORF Transcript_477/g.1658 Transcript_477/m.1658 type:complete len:249 (+) Transcript_477:85-831(+)